MSEAAAGETTVRRAGRNLVRTIIIVVVVLLVYALAVQMTDINLAKPLSPDRQENLIRVLRLLADPELVSIDEETGQMVLSVATRITVERIIETIFMALLASTIGTVLAIPLSFLAARNLMENITWPLASISAAIVALVVGGAIGWWIASRLVSLSATMADPPLLGLGLLLLAAVLLWLVSRVGPSIENQTAGMQLLSGARTVLALLLAIFGLGLLGQLGLLVGEWLENNLGPFGFLGNFVLVLSDVLRLFLPAIVAFLAGLVTASFASRYAQEAVISWRHAAARLLTAILAAFATAFVIYAVGSFLNWLYEFDNPQNWTTVPALVGAMVGAIVGLIIKPNRPFRIGFTVYAMMRSILNILRAIEPLIMGIVFVVWVSLGPFAGIMALTLHSIAALGKLFSEQVEGIDEGPVEAITATGASRLQMVTYAVIPQIVPPFTAFALYRWDINVRMSTIIGFVGGGGIGFVLSQNIQQLRYRQASVMMLAIAIVVALLDYASSRIRSRII